MAVLLVAAAAFAHGHGARDGGWWGSKGWKDVGGKGWKGGAGWRRGVGYVNIALSVATRQVTISGDGIKAVFTVDVVGVDVPWSGRVVYGAGTVELGGVSYTAKSVAGFFGRNVAELTIYTGSAVIKIKYRNGMYYAVVRPLSTAGFQRFNGTATLTVT